MQDALKLSPNQIGIAFLVLPFVEVIFAPMVGVLQDRHRRAPLLPLSLFGIVIARAGIFGFQYARAGDSWVYPSLLVS